MTSIAGPPNTISSSMIMILKKPSLFVGHFERVRWPIELLQHTHTADAEISYG